MRVSNIYVGRFFRLRDGLRYGLLTLLLALAVIISAIPIQQQILRHRAERLLADIRSLTLRRSSWIDVQGVFRRWGAWGHYDGACTQQNCSYTIELGDFTSTHRYLTERLLSLEPLYDFFGGRASLIRAEVDVQDGMIWSKGFWLFVEVPPEQPPRNYAYTLEASARSVSRFVGFRSSLADHPNYIVKTPDACTGCTALQVEFTPYADRTDVERLMQFNLSCLTKWHPCREKAEIMPAAWTQYMSDADAGSNHTAAPMQQECSSYPLAVLGRDAANAAIVDIAGNRTDRGDETFQVSTVRLVKRLKASSFWNVGTNREVRVFEGTVSRSAHNEPEEVRAGASFIMLFSHSHERGPNGPEVWLDLCGAVPMTEQNLKEVLRGIDEDYLAGLARTRR
jgi:hypothetical protein